MESSSLASTIEKDLQKEGYKKVDVDKADAEVTTVQENVPTLRSRQVSRYALWSRQLYILPVKSKTSYSSPSYPFTNIIHFLTSLTLNIT